MHLPIRLLLALCLFFALVSPALAQDWAGKGRLNGQVFDQNDDPIEGAQVYLLREGEGPEPLTTSKKGRWSYLGLAGGQWTLRVEKEGFVPQEGPVMVNPFGVSKSPVVTLRQIPEEVLAQAAITESMKHLETGNQFLSEGKSVEARTEYESALAGLEVESHPPVLIGIARTYYQEENFEATEHSLERVLELEPDNVEALKLLSSILVAQGREEEAKPLMERLPEGELLDADTYLNVGIDLYNEGKLDEALVEFQRVVESFPDLPAAYYYRGLVLLNHGKNAEAKADFEKLLELAPDSPRAAEAQSFLDYLEQGG